MSISRRGFLAASAGTGLMAATAGAWVTENTASCDRRFHLSISPDALDADPELLDIVRQAGVTDLWVTGFLYGYWYYPIEKTQAWRKRIEQKGLAAHVINVPLGHPGDSLGAKSGTMPLTPPRHWRLGLRPDGSQYAGTSLHKPATEENVEAMRILKATNVKRVFLDDDFRLAQGPGVIGGCFCPEHKQEFLRRTGYGEGQWKELLDAVKNRVPTPVLRAWVDYTCDQLTASFRAQQAAAPDVRLGIMVMYFGAEKAGIRLTDYQRVPFRVGELMFEDGSFNSLKGKTDELFSCLFHRRFASPENSYSETTAYPADRLSAANMAAKLAISTISDVRNTMFMSGVTAFPRTHWQTLAPAMRRQAALHKKLAGHAPRGPLKHFWGEASRYVGDDNPYSLFLTLGIPFEVTESPGKDGYTFLADADAHSVFRGDLRSRGTSFIARPAVGDPRGPVRIVAETPADLAALKQEIVPRLGSVPYVEGNAPVVCSWYPTARTVLLWNLSPERREFVLRFRDTRRVIAVDGLDTALAEEVYY